MDEFSNLIRHKVLVELRTNKTIYLIENELYPYH